MSDELNLTAPSRGTAPTRDTLPVSNANVEIIPRTSTSIQRSFNTGIAYPSRVPNIGLSPATATAPESFRATYGTATPFDILADLFLRTSTGFDSAPPSNSGVIAVDPGVSGSGGSLILIMLVLGIAAVAIWYFYFR